MTTELGTLLTALIGGLAMLIYFADRFVIGAANLAKNLGVSSLIIGLTIVGFGTSAPEILVSSFAAWQGNTGLAVGNALGSNIANIGLILGCTAILAPITIQSGTLRREIPILLLACLLAFAFSYDQRLEAVEGALLSIGLVAFLVWLIWQARKAPSYDPLIQEVDDELQKSLSLGAAGFWCLLGLAGLLFSSRLLVWAAVGIAHHFDISDLIIGLTIVALGTSLPELAASIASVLKHENDLAMGNIIGSNMFNILAVYAMPALLNPGTLQPQVVHRDFPWMLGLTAALYVLGLGRRNPSKIGRSGGVLLILGFAFYQYFIYLELRS